LLIVFWALLVLSAAIVAWSEWINQGILIDADANRGLEARAMAHSGMAVALNPGVTKLTPLLEKEFSPSLSYRVKMVSEGGRLNINWLLTGEDPQKLGILKLWLEQRGLNAKERDVLVDCLLDYVDADNVPHLNGVEDQGDYHAANRPFESVDEIAQVWGAEPLTRTPGWKDNLTIYSSGPIDLVAAPIDILRLIPGLSETRIQRFVQMRVGQDGIEGTADDPEFGDLGQIFSLLGISANAAELLQPLVTVNDPTTHITSEGRSAKVVRQLEVVTRKGGGNPQILYWKE
jgi:hypothetical protein